MSEESYTGVEILVSQNITKLQNVAQKRTHYNFTSHKYSSFITSCWLLVQDPEDVEA